MESTVSEASGFDRVCPECARCFTDDPEICPSCEVERPEGGWLRREETEHEYLGTVIGERYRLEQFLGRGAAGSVYRARDMRLQRPFAVKILDAAPRDSSEDLSRVRDQFRNEVEALSRIRNPHVINIHEALTLDGGVPAMLTEYVEGPTLAEMLQEQGRLGLESAVTLVHQIANGLHEAHCRQVVHRDVKPSNIIVEQLPASGMFARILDFGLVHLVEEGERRRGFRGTPLYAAPEQCRGTGAVTAAADIYSLGCVTYHLLAGRPPFDYEDARTILFSHVDRRPERLGEVAPEEIPEDLDELVARMLEKEPADRPGDLSEVVGELESILLTTSASRSMPGADTGAGLGPTTSQIARVNDDEEGTEASEFERHAEETNKLEQLVQFVDLDEKFEEFEAPVVACAVDALGDSAVLSDAEGRLAALSLRGEGFAQTYASIGERVVGISIQSRVGSLVGITETGRVLEWSLASVGAEPSELCVLDEGGYAVGIGPRSQQVYVAGGAGVLHRYDLRVGRREAICELPGAIASLRIVESGNRAVATTLGGEIAGVEDLRVEAEPVTLANIGREPHALAYYREASAILVGAGDGRVYSYQLGGSGGLEVVDTSLEDLRGLAVTREHMVLGFSIRETLAQTVRVRHERLQRSLEWLDPREMSVRQDLSKNVLERHRRDADGD